MGVLQELEKELGKPVLSTSQVTLWHALKLAGHRHGVKGFGGLLAQAST
jgi:maleate isomerase